MSEKKEEKKPIIDDLTHSRRLEHDMSMAPFLGVAKIEYEKSYEEFEATLTELEKSKELNWMDFFAVEKELGEIMPEGALVAIETKKYRCTYTSKPGFESKKFRTDDTHKWASKFYTWDEVVAMMKLWKKEKFNPRLIVEPDFHCINRNFRHVHIFKHRLGYLIANQFDMTYPEEIMKACIRL